MAESASVAWPSARRFQTKAPPAPCGGRVVSGCLLTNGRDLTEMMAAPNQYNHVDQKKVLQQTDSLTAK